MGIHQHNLYEELCRIREIFAMQTIVQGMGIRAETFDTSDPHQVAMADHYQKMMEKCIHLAFPERTMREYDEDELCNICLKPRQICREECSSA